MSVYSSPTFFFLPGHGPSADGRRVAHGKKKGWLLFFDTYLSRSIIALVLSQQPVVVNKAVTPVPTAAASPAKVKKWMVVVVFYTCLPMSCAV